MDVRRLSPTHRKMLEMLSDGEPHTREELHTCLYDEMTGIEQVRVQISTLRKVLPHSEDIMCRRYGGVITYQHVRVLASPYRE